MLNQLCQVLLLEVWQLKLRCIDLLDVFCWQDVVSKVFHKLWQLLVVFVPVKGQYRDTIGELESKWVNSIVDEDYVFDLPVSDDSQVLDVDTLTRSDTILSVETWISPFWVNKFVEDSVSILLMTGSENADLEAHLFALS